MVWRLEGGTVILGAFDHAQISRLDGGSCIAPSVAFLLAGSAVEQY